MQCIWRHLLVISAVCLGVLSGYHHVALVEEYLTQSLSCLYDWTLFLVCFLDQTLALN